jgi:hypothetical protein
VGYGQIKKMAVMGGRALKALFFPSEWAGRDPQVNAFCKFKQEEEKGTVQLTREKRGRRKGKRKHRSGGGSDWQLWPPHFCLVFFWW